MLAVDLLHIEVVGLKVVVESYMVSVGLTVRRRGVVVGLEIGHTNALECHTIVKEGCFD